VIQVASVAELRNLLDREAGASEWIEVTQDRIDRFAEATGDLQWIHVDPVRSATESPFKTTIAHGFLTLSLVSAMARTALHIDGVRMAINYGLNRVRFVAPVPAGTRIRGRFMPIAMSAEGDHVQVTWRITVEREQAAKPCCVAEWVVRYYQHIQ
jgi:acyl dehydratase